MHFLRRSTKLSMTFLQTESYQYPKFVNVHLEGKANFKTNVFLGSSRPNEVATKPLHSPKCTVWAEILARGIIGPIFIEESGAAVTVTKECYVEVLKTFKSELQSLYSVAYEQVLVPARWSKFSHLKFVPRLNERELRRPNDHSPD